VVGISGKSVQLDVREDIKNKQEPFQKIMSSIKDLTVGDTFVLHAPFKPVPLIPVIEAKGFAHEIEEKAKDHWVVTFVKQS
jgi:uncharacterized protein (DUF2249 family)